MSINKTIEMLPTIQNQEGTEFKLIHLKNNKIADIEMYLSDISIGTLFTELKTNKNLRTLLFIRRSVLRTKPFLLEEEREETWLDNYNPLLNINFPVLLGQDGIRNNSTVILEEDIHQQQVQKLKIKRSFKSLEEHIEKYVEVLGSLIENMIKEKEGISLQKDEKLFEIGKILILRLIEDIKKPVNRKNIDKMFGDLISDNIIDVLLFSQEEWKYEVFKLFKYKYKKINSSIPLSEKEYNKNIDALLKITKSIHPLTTIQWCNFSSHRAFPYSMIIHAHNEIPNSKCPICNKKISSMTCYVFKTSITSVLRKEDGMLPYFIMWLLEENNFSWNPNCFIENDSGSSEIDIIAISKNIEGYLLIECKTFDLMVDEEKVLSRIISAMNRIQKVKLKHFQEKNIIIFKTILIINFDLSSNIEIKIQKKLRRKKFALLSQNNFTLLHQGNINNFIKMLKLIQENKWEDEMII